MARKLLVAGSLVLLLAGCGSSHLDQAQLAKGGTKICAHEAGLLGSLGKHESNVEVGVEWPRLRKGAKLRNLLQQNANVQGVPALLAAIRVREDAYDGLESTGMTEKRAKQLVRTLKTAQARIEKTFLTLGMRRCTALDIKPPGKPQILIIK